MSANPAQRINPFPGLRPFRSDEHHLFFGREEQTAALLQLLRQNRFLAVVGTSGSGKSSLVRAGMMAELYGGTMTQAGSTWEVILLRPGGSPIENLARALVDADLYDAEDPHTLPRLRATLNRSRFGLVEAVKQSDVFEPGTNLLVVVDQFEELFRFRQQGAGSEEAAAAFVNLLLTASEQQECRIYVTITMRSDYLGDCSEIPGLAEAVNEGEYLIPRLLRDQKRAAIEKPIGVGGAQIAPLLVQRLLNEVGDDPDQLPVLQHALMRMWDAWVAESDGSRPIDLPDFEATGGLATALSYHADEIYDCLPDDLHRRACERIFKTLTEKGADNRGIRRPTRLAQLGTIAGVDRVTVSDVLDAFRQPGVTFLMPGIDFELTDGTVVDLSHESLMRGWRRLRGWVEEEAQSARIFRRLLDTARLWHEGKAGLFRDPDLQIALSWREQQQPNADWAEQYGGQFETAITFLDKSGAEAAAEQQAQEAARQRELQQAQKLAEVEHQRAELQRRAALRLRGMVAGFAIVAIIAVVASIVAYSAKRDADRARLLAVQNADAAEASAADAHREATRATASEAVAMAAQSALQEKEFSSDMTLAQHAYEAGNIGAVSERLLEHVSGSGESDPRGVEWYLWWNASHLESSVVNRGGSHAFSVAVSPDGRLAADSHWYNSIRLRETANPQNVKSFAVAGAGELRWLSFSPDSAMLAAVEQNRIQRFSAQEAKSLGSVGAPAGLAGLSFSPTGDVVVSGGHDGHLYFWDTASWERSDFLASTESLPIRSVAYSPDGAHLAIGTDSGRNNEYAVLGAYSPLLLWDTATNSVQKTAAGHAARISSVAWSPDGEYLASGSADETVRVWTKELSPVKTLNSLAGVSEVAFSPSGQYLAAGTSKDNAIRVWNTDSWELVTTIKGHSKPVRDIAFDPRRGDLWSASEDSTIKIWNIEGLLRQPVATLHDEALRTMLTSTDRSVVANDGRTLFCSGQDAPIVRYDLESGAAMLPWSGGTSFRQAAFSDDGTGLTAVSADGLVRVWRTNSEEPIAETQMPAEDVSTLHALGVSSGATIVAWAAGNPLHLVLVDTRNGNRQQLPLGLNNGGWRFLTISPDGKRLSVKSSFDFRMLDISGFASNGRLRAEPESLAGTNLANSFVFSLDGKLGAAARFDSVIYLRDLESNQELQTLAGHSSEVNCAAFSRDGRRLVSGSEDGTVRVWDVETGDSLTTLQGHSGPISWVGFRKDERAIISISHADGLVRVWSAIGHEELPQSAVYWRELAEHRRQMGQSAQAIKAYGEAIRLSPEDADLVRSRAELNFSLAGVDAAISDRVKLITMGVIDPNLVDSVAAVARQTTLLAPNSDENNRSWRYTFQRQDNGWHEPGFDDSTWKVDASPFGSSSADATKWDSADIWLRCEFELSAPISEPLSIRAYCDDHAEFYLNGVLAAEGHWIGRRYQAITCSPEAAAALQPGRNVLAVHCLNTGGDARIDAGLYINDVQRWIKLLTEALEGDPQNVHLLQARFRAFQEQGSAELAAADAAVALSGLRAAVQSELMNSDVVWPKSAGLLADMLLESHQSAAPNDWQVLELVEMTSAGGASLTRLPDGSILAGGTNPDSDAYTIIAETDLTNVSALRIEALTHPSLPRGGPGRDTKRDLGNFGIVNLNIRSGARTQPDTTSPVRFDKAWANYNNGSLEELLQGRWNTGGRGGQQHQAVFRVQQPVGHEEGVRLVFKMQFQTSPDWPGQNLGRFRLSAAADASTWQKVALANGLRDLPGEWNRLAAAYYLVGDTEGLDRLLEHKPHASVGIGDLYASVEDWEQAITLYSRLVSPDTTDAGLLVKRGEAYAGLSRWDDAEADWRRAANLQPGILQEPFDRLRLASDWQSAAKIGVILIEQDPENRFLWLRTAPAFVLAGDEPGYHAFCRRMVAQFANTTDQYKAESTCKACSLIPGAVDLSQLPLKVFAEPLDQGTTPAGLHPWAWAARALVAYRRDNVSEVSPYLQEAWKSQPSPEARALTYSIAALDRHRRGDLDGAREALGHVKTITDQRMPNATAAGLHDLLIPMILAREAERLLAGEETPETTDDSD